MKIKKTPYSPKRFKLKPISSLLLLAILAASAVYSAQTLKTSRIDFPKAAMHITPTITEQLLPTPTEYTAAFAIFTNGTFRTFTDSQYHHQSADAYLELQPANVIQIKRPGITWGEFFDTLPMKLSTSCLTTGTGQLFCADETHQLQFYLNGKQTPDLLTQPINPNDRLLITYGLQDLDTLNQQWLQVPQP